MVRGIPLCSTHSNSALVGGATPWPLHPQEKPSVLIVSEGGLSPGPVGVGMEKSRSLVLTGV
jgi:hypothetical protein